MSKSAQFLAVLFLLFLGEVSGAGDTLSELYKIVLMIKDCLTNNTFPAVCLKERALESLNRTIFIEEPIMVGFLRIEKNPEYDWNNTQSEALPNEIEQRSIVLNDALYDKLEQFFKSRTIKLNVDEAVEGRKIGGGGGGGGGGGKGKGVMMMMGAAAACVGAGMMVGKMGMMAMTALMLSKISLLLSAIMILKKSKGGGGGGDEKEKQIKIIYATSGGGGGGGGDWSGGKGGGGGGGGWHRSMGHDAQTITYRAQIPPDESGNVYEGY